MSLETPVAVADEGDPAEPLGRWSRRVNSPPAPADAQMKRTSAQLRLCHARSVGWRIDPEGVETRALAELAPVAGLRVLELGCGDGRLTFRYASDAAAVLAVDPDEGEVEKARNALKPTLADKVTFAVSGAAEVDAPRRSFDLALFAWSL